MFGSITSKRDRTCIGCNNEFVATSPSHKRCNPNCGRTKRQRNPGEYRDREHHNIDFISIDGEGADIEGRHTYLCISVGDRTIADPSGLTPEAIFDFLWENFLDQPNAAYVGFFLNYDFTMWLRDLPPSRGHMLMHRDGIAKRQRVNSGGNTIPFPVQWNEWELDILMSKRFKLRRAGSTKWMYICDAGPFFQSSFLAAINPKSWNVPICSPEDYATIKEGKDNRSTAILGPDMVRYNVTENKVMADLMANLNRGLVDGCDVRLKKNQWFGPGQAAQAWMENVDAPTNEQVTLAVPPHALQAARDAYYGGWFEIFAHGHVPGTVFEYDINSAYPAIIAKLPCLLHGKWIFGNGVNNESGTGRITLIYGTATGSNPKLGAMLHRSSISTILRPGETRGWFWEHELSAARRAGAVDTFHGEKWISYAPCDCLPPLRAVEKLYRKRLAVGKNAPGGKALKLVYNSVYGKCCQSAGNPKFANAIYASLITAGCRTMMLDAIATHPHGIRDLVMCATDGIYFTTPHPNLNLDPEGLGMWDQSTKSNLTLLMPGVYWDDTTRQALAENLEVKLKSRGIAARDLSLVVPRFDAQWESWTPGEAHPSTWPHLSIPLAFSLLSAKSAAHRGKWELAGTVDRDARRLLSAFPGAKRHVTRLTQVEGRWESRCRRPEDGWIELSTGHKRPLQLETLPYQKSFGMVAESEYVTPDGDEADMIREAILEGNI